MTVKMYLVVNQSLKEMRTGKAAGQCAHGAAMMTRNMERKLPGVPPISIRVYEDWIAHGETKVVLKADEETMLHLLAKYPDDCVTVRDAGKTQIPANSLTVLAFYPLAEPHVPSELKSLKLMS